jgi:hypothetical protein
MEFLKKNKLPAHTSGIFIIMIALGIAHFAYGQIPDNFIYVNPYYEAYRFGGCAGIPEPALVDQCSASGGYSADSYYIYCGFNGDPYNLPYWGGTSCYLPTTCAAHGLAGTPPFCYAATCPAGQIGSPPSCRAPTCADNPALPGCACPAGQIGTQPICTAIPPPTCTNGSPGPYPACPLGPPPPVCAANAGTQCSVSNSCGAATNYGTWDCAGTSCSASAPSEATCAPPPPPPGPPVCSDAGPVSVTASPSRVQSGVPTSVTFTSSASNALGTCTLSGPGITTQNYTPTSAPSCTLAPTTYTTTITITAQSAYTLTCGSQTLKVFVNAVPKFKEF